MTRLPAWLGAALVTVGSTAAQAGSNFESSKLSPGVVVQGNGLESPKLSAGVVVQGNGLQSAKLAPGVVVQGASLQSPKISVGVVVQSLPSATGVVLRAPLTHL